MKIFVRSLLIALALAGGFRSFAMAAPGGNFNQCAHVESHQQSGAEQECNENGY